MRGQVLYFPLSWIKSKYHSLSMNWDKTPRRWETDVYRDVAQWLVRRNSNPKTLGSIPWWGGVRDMFVCPSQTVLVQTCLCLTLPRVRTTRTHIYAHVKDPTSICRKSVGLTGGGMHTRKHCIQGKKTSWIAPYCGCSISPGKASRISRALHWDKKSNLI